MTLSRCVKVMEIRTSGGGIIGILKKIKDADPFDSHHAPEWKERQNSRMEGLRSRLLMGRSSPVRRERLPAGALQRELACDAGVRRSGA